MANILDVFLGAATQSYNTGAGTIGPGTYLIVGNRQTSNGPAIIHFSDDGINWITKPCVSLNFGYDLVESIWDGTKYIATGGVTVASNDGQFWAQVSPIAARGIAYNGAGRYVMVGANAQVYVSDNGINWTQVPGQLSYNGTPLPPIYVNINIQGQGDYYYATITNEVDFINGYFVISGTVRSPSQVALACTWISSDGIEWTARQLPYNGVVFGTALNSAGDTNIFSLQTEAPPVQQPGLSGTYVANRAVDPRFIDNGDIAFGNNTLIAVVSPTGVATPPLIYRAIYFPGNGSLSNFISVPYPNSVNVKQLNKITYYNGFFYIVGITVTNQPVLYLSNTDGATWTYITLSASTAIPYHITVI